MIEIKKKPLTPNIIWDSSAGRPLCNFGHKGTITTNDRELAERLAALGHEVTGEAEAPAQPEETTAQEPQVDQTGETAEAPAQSEEAPASNGRRNRK